MADHHENPGIDGLKSRGDLARFIRKTVEEPGVVRRQVTAASFSDLTLENGWTGIGGYATPGYWIDGTGRCWLRGAVSGGSSSTAVIATLPANACPAATFRAMVNSNSAGAPFQITTAGVISVYSGGSTASVILENVSFPT